MEINTETEQHLDARSKLLAGAAQKFVEDFRILRTPDYSANLGADGVGLRVLVHQLAVAVAAAQCKVAEFGYNPSVSKAVGRI